MVKLDEGPWIIDERFEPKELQSSPWRWSKEVFPRNGEERSTNLEEASASTGLCYSY
jgi:hypothetical protein